MSLDASPPSLREIFLAALELDNDFERGVFLDKIAGVGTERRREVEQLLAAHEAGLSGPLDAVARLVPTEVLPKPELDANTHLAKQIGPYKLREQIGEGGFGVVYVAEQSAPVRRKVALKIIKPGMDTQEVIARFEAEKQALAMMDHPHIAKVFDAGTTDTGRPYFVMELIRGLPITQYCREKKLDLREELKLFVDVCRAVQHAHQKGVIHRDLKPSNILITLHDGEPVVKIIDFGIAKALHQKLSEQTVYTRHAQLIGTPMYMSPEQAEWSGLDVDTRSDVYSLGVLLYELLTGTPPFDKEVLLSKGFDEMRRIIREDDPPRPSHRVSTLDIDLQSTLEKRRGLDPREWNLALKRELDWIVMKALEKNRERRYESASAFAADVDRYLKDEPVEACPPSLEYRLRKSVKRHKWLLATGGLVLVTAILGVVVSLSYARQAAISAKDARAAQQTAEDHATEAAANARSAEENARAADEAKEWSRTLLYASDMKLVSDALANRDVPRAAELLRRHVPKARVRDLRGFEWHFYHKQIHQTPHAVLDLGGYVRDVEISPDGRWLAAISALGSVQIYRTADWSRQKWFLTMTESVYGLAWSPDAQTLAASCADGSVRIFENATGSQRLAIAAHVGIAKDVAFSPDGRRLFSCGDDHVARCWSADTGEEMLTFSGHNREVERIAVSPDGMKLATASSDSSFALWEIRTAKRLHRIPSSSRVVCVQFSPNGRFVAAGNITGTLFLTDVESGDSTELSKKPDGIESLSFVHNGKWLVTAGRGGAIQYHSMPTSIAKAARSVSVPLLHWVAHQGRALSLTATPDSQSLVSGGQDNIVRVWSPDLDATQWSIALDPKRVDIDTGLGDRLYLAGREISIWDLNERRGIGSFAKVEPRWSRIACSADGRFLAAIRPGELAVFDLDTFEMVQEWVFEEQLQLHRVGISEDGRWIAMAEFADRDFVTVYDRLGKRPPRQFPASQSNTVAFSPGGRLLATGHMDDVHLFDLKRGGEPLRLKGHTNSLTDVVFSPDGEWLASVSDDRLLKMWDLETGTERASIVAYDDRIRSVDLSPDGATFAVAGHDNVVKLWHVATGQALGDMTRPVHWLRKVRFSVDGLKLIALDSEGQIVVYDASRSARSTVVRTEGSPERATQDPR